MARYDKYDPIAGGFRAPLGADWDNADVGVPTGVGLDANGRVIKGASTTGVLGVLVDDGRMAAGTLTGKKAGEIVDVMTAGEIVDCDDLDAGTVYFLDATTGALEDTAPAAGANGVRAGHTVEATRLVVRVAPMQTAD